MLLGRCQHGLVAGWVGTLSACTLRVPVRWQPKREEGVPWFLSLHNNSLYAWALILVKHKTGVGRIRFMRYIVQTSFYPHLYFVIPFCVCTCSSTLTMWSLLSAALRWLEPSPWFGQRAIRETALSTFVFPIILLNRAAASLLTHQGVNRNSQYNSRPVWRGDSSVVVLQVFSPPGDAKNSS